MEQVKIFSSGNSTELETKINTWLKENQGEIEIIQREMSTTGTQYSCYVTVVYHYIVTR
jgi:hypothetical protein